MLPTPTSRAAGLGSAVAVLVLVLAPARRAAVVAGWRAAVASVVLAAIAIVVTGRLRPASWSSRLAVAVVAGLGVYALTDDRVTAAWVVVSVVLTDWAVRGRRPFPGMPPGHDSAVAPVVVLSLVAVWRSGEGGSGKQVLMALLVAVVATSAASVLRAKASRAIRAVGSSAGTVVATVGFGALGVAVAVVPWLAQRVLRVDPLTDGSSRSTAWVRRARRDVQPDDPWAPDPALRQLSGPLKFRRLLVGPLAVVIVAAFAGGAVALVMRTGDGDDAAQGPGGAGSAVPPAVADLEWWPEYQQELVWMFEGSGFDPFGIPRVKDMETPFTEVMDGVRRSWRPPECECERLVVWVYGGSTTFGLGQRDEHTIPSEIARAAWKDGVAVDVVNRGVPGDMHWQEADRLAWDLASEPPPDLVVFYDGVNELAGSMGRNEDRSGDHEARTDQVMDRLRREGVLPEPVAEAPPGVRLVEADEVVLGPGELAEHAVARYDTARRVSSTYLAARSVPAVWFWQPAAATRDPGGSAVGDPAVDGWSRDLYDGAAAHLPADVHDLSEVFDRTSGPIFYDHVHTNERGAQIVAESIYRLIEPLLSAREETP